jgi:hypothetical protein
MGPLLASTQELPIPVRGIIRGEGVGGIHKDIVEALRGELSLSGEKMELSQHSEGEPSLRTLIRAGEYLRIEQLLYLRGVPRMTTEADGELMQPSGVPQSESPNIPKVAWCSMVPKV